MLPCVDSCFVNRIEPALVQVDNEHDIISEAGNPVGGGHGDDEREQIVDERVERLVHEGPPGQVSHRLELVVEKLMLLILW